MTKKFYTFAAAVFALLTITAPAHAATDEEAVNLRFGGVNQLVGNIDFRPYAGPAPYDPSYYYTNLSFLGMSR